MPLRAMDVPCLSLPSSCWCPPLPFAPTPPSHPAVMEKYTRNARFCLICNYVSKIIPALQSRCTRFRFQPLPQQFVRSRLDYICTQEGWVQGEGRLGCRGGCRASPRWAAGGRPGGGLGPRPEQHLRTALVSGGGLQGPASCTCCRPPPGSLLAAKSTTLLTGARLLPTLVCATGSRWRLAGSTR